MPSNQIVIAISKGKAIRLLLMSIVLIGMSTFNWYIASHQKEVKPIYIQIISIIGIGFFSLGVPFFISKLLQHGPALIIDDDWIEDNSGWASVGRIPWKEIKGIHNTRLLGQQFIRIDVENPFKYIEHFNFIKRKLCKINQKYFGSPIQISANIMDINFNELASSVNQAFEQSHKHQK